jgi:hypothetical protein
MKVASDDMDGDEIFRKAHDKNGRIMKSWADM